jgi:hypothetical protein
MKGIKDHLGTLVKCLERILALFNGSIIQVVYRR